MRDNPHAFCLDHFDAQVSKRDIPASIAYLSFVYNTWNTRYDSGYPLVITSSLLKVRPLSLIRIVLADIYFVNEILS